MKLIPNDITVEQQFKILGKFLRLVENWAGVPRYNIDQICFEIDVDELLKDSGVKCQLLNNRLVGFEIVNKQAYLMFMLRWS